MEEETPPEITSLVCFGFGSGYFIKEIISKNTRFKKILCYEPPGGSLNLLEIQKQKSNLEKQSAIKGIQVEILDILNFTIPDSYVTFSLPYYSRNYKEDWDCFQNYLKQGKKKIEEETRKAFSKSWFRNYFRNIDLSLNHSSCFWVQKQDFSSVKTVLFVGASPRLETEIALITKIRKYVLLISSDTSLFFLLSMGLTPDLILSVDSGRGTTFHFRDSIPHHIPILTWLSGNSMLWDFGNPILLYLSSFPLDQVLLGCMKNPVEISNPSLNQAGLALGFSKFIGAEKFIISGVGFYVENAKTHCRGTGYENYRLPQIHRKSTLENYSPHTYMTGQISQKNKIAKEYLESNGAIPIYDGVINTPVTGSGKKSDFSFSFRKTPIHDFWNILQKNEIKKEIQNQLFIEERDWKKIFYFPVERF